MKVTSTTIVLAISGATYAMPLPNGLLPGDVQPDCSHPDAGPKCVPPGNFLHHLASSEDQYLQLVHPQQRDTSRSMQSYGYPPPSRSYVASGQEEEEGEEGPEEETNKNSSTPATFAGIYSQPNHPSASTPFTSATGSASESKLQMADHSAGVGSSSVPIVAPTRVYAGTLPSSASTSSLQASDRSKKMDEGRESSTSNQASLSKTESGKEGGAKSGEEAEGVPPGTLADKLLSKGTLAPLPSTPGHTTTLPDEKEESKGGPGGGGSKAAPLPVTEGKPSSNEDKADVGDKKTPADASDKEGDKTKAADAKAASKTETVDANATSRPEDVDGKAANQTGSPLAPLGSIPAAAPNATGITHTPGLPNADAGNQKDGASTVFIPLFSVALAAVVASLLL